MKKQIRSKQFGIKKFLQESGKIFHKIIIRSNKKIILLIFSEFFWFLIYIYVYIVYYEYYFMSIKIYMSIKILVLYNNLYTIIKRKCNYKIWIYL